MNEIMTYKQKIKETQTEIADLYNQRERIEKAIDAKYKYMGMLSDEFHHRVRVETPKY